MDKKNSYLYYYLSYLLYYVSELPCIFDLHCIYRQLSGRAMVA